MSQFISLSSGQDFSSNISHQFFEALNPLKNSSSLKFSLHGCLSIDCGESVLPTLIYSAHLYLSNITCFCSHDDYWAVMFLSLAVLSEDDCYYLIHFYLPSIIANDGEAVPSAQLLISKGMITGLIIDTSKLFSSSLLIYCCPFKRLSEHWTPHQLIHFVRFSVVISCCYKYKYIDIYCITGWSTGPPYTIHPTGCI